MPISWYFRGHVTAASLKHEFFAGKPGTYAISAAT